jgi:nucleotide-binding universal stress UspA family protein
MFKNVIAGVDDSDGSRDAIALAERLVEKDGELTLVYAYWAETHVWHGSSAAYDAVARDQARELLEKAREEAGIEARLLWHGSSSVGRGLHALANTIGADLLVIGSSRRGLLGRVLVEDDTLASLNGARCAVASALQRPGRCCGETWTSPTDGSRSAATRPMPGSARSTCCRCCARS